MVALTKENNREEQAFIESVAHQLFSFLTREQKEELRRLAGGSDGIRKAAMKFAENYITGDKKHKELGQKSIPEAIEWAKGLMRAGVPLESIVPVPFNPDATESIYEPLKAQLQQQTKPKGRKK